jgi:rhodanese-related sulfurtransferase
MLMLALSLAALSLTGCDTSQQAAQSSPTTPVGEQPAGATDGDGTQGGSAATLPVTPPATPVPIADENRITAEEAHEALRDKKAWTVIDLRDYSKYVVGHVPGAKALPFRYLEERMKEIPREQELVLVFADPEEAQATWDILCANGYDPALVRIMDDGLAAWIDAGYETEVKAATHC